jgi:hypothetical protein
MTCRPGHSPRWPDFEHGNMVALRHGASSDRAIAARQVETRAELLEVAPWLADAADADAVARYLRVETRARMLDEWIVDTIRAKGPQAVKPWAWEQARSADRLAAELGHSLGLDPIGRVRLQRETASAERGKHDLARMWAEEALEEGGNGTG